MIFAIRGPRILGAMLVGAALASAGAAYQGLFRNPLVSPDILGVSSGAALGAVLGIFLALPVVGIEATRVSSAALSRCWPFMGSPPPSAAAIRSWCWC